MAGYLLDTNVISELVRPAPDAQVLAWMAAREADELFLSVLTIGELARGVHCRPPSRRRRTFERWIADDLAHEFAGRVLSFDYAAATVWGAIMGEADRRGRPRPAADAQIAAVARVYGLTLATRNTRDFVDMDVDLLDPWQA